MLNTIIETKKREVAELYKEEAHGNNLLRTGDVDSRALPFYSFIDALKQPNRKLGLIAEVKRASPSKGIIREQFHPVQIARDYDRANADCLSVLTDRTYFKGDSSYIAEIKEHVSLPIIRKDFIIDRIQIYESVRLGADAILLIAKALPVETLVSLYTEAEAVGLQCLIEVANEHELEDVFTHLHPPLIGVNNRDLRTFKTNIGVTKSLMRFIPEDVLVISESGIHTSHDIEALAQCGVSGCLIGEYFMRQEHIKKAVDTLYGPSENMREL